MEVLLRLFYPGISGLGNNKVLETLTCSLYKFLFGIIVSFEALNGIIVSLVIIFYGLELLLFDRLRGVLIYNFFLEEMLCYLLGHVLSMIMYS